jgi:uncharacterized protein (TIGR00725 family)
VTPAAAAGATSSYVAVVGAGGVDVAPEVLAVAEAVGAELGRRGAVVVTGGLGGVMEAACRGARSTGATTLGILPGADRGAANPFVSVAVATGLGELRNGLVVRSADAVVAIAGGAGTLSEIAFALKAGKPVAGIETWRIDGVADAADADAAVAFVFGD